MKNILFILLILMPLRVTAAVSKNVLIKFPAESPTRSAIARVELRRDIGDLSRGIAAIVLVTGMYLLIGNIRKYNTHYDGHSDTDVVSLRRREAARMMAIKKNIILSCWGVAWFVLSYKMA